MMNLPPEHSLAPLQSSAGAWPPIASPARFIRMVPMDRSRHAKLAALKLVSFATSLGTRTKHANNSSTGQGINELKKSYLQV